METPMPERVTAADIVRAKFMDELNEEVGGREVIDLCKKLELMRKDDDGPICSICGNVKRWVKYSNYTDGYAWRCCFKYKDSHRKNQWCKQHISIRTGTLFENSNLPLSTILIMLNYFCAKMNLDQIVKQCTVNSKTSIEWAKMFRAVLLDSFIFNAPQIGGRGKTVEIDESKFGKRKYHRGRRVDGTWIFGGIERESGRAFMVPVQKRSAAYLVPIITHFIAPETTIISDCWRAYDCLEDEGFTHLTVNHSVTFVNPDNGAHTNTIEGLWRHAKESVGNKSRRKHLMDGYIAKYLFFKFCRKSKVDVFLEFCKLAGKYFEQNEDTLTDRAATWFELKEQLDDLVLDEEQIVNVDDNGQAIGEEIEEESQSEPDDAEFDNPDDLDWEH